MKKSKLAINSVSTRHANLEEALAAYSAAGFEYVEFVIPTVKEYLATGKTVSDVRRLLDQYKLKCIGGFETHLCVFSSPAECAQNHDLHVANAKLLGELGGTGMVTGTDGWGMDFSKIEKPIETIAAGFASVAKRIEGTGVTLLMEFNWSPIVKSFRTGVEVAKKSKVKNVKVVFDPAHYHCTPSKFEQLTKENVAFVGHVHVDDMRDIPGELSNCNSDRVLPGKGCLDLKALLGAVEKHGYRGFYSIEMFNEELWAMPAAKAAKLMYKSLLPYCRG